MLSLNSIAVAMMIMSRLLVGARTHAACYCLDCQDDYAYFDIAEPDGIVDIFEIAMIAKSYGEEYNR